MDKYIVAPPNGSTNNGIGAADRKWKEGHFEKLLAEDVVAKGPVVDVRAFGAVGDGVTDDTAAIQAAIDYVGCATYTEYQNNIKGGTLYIPRGKYRITSPIYINPQMRVIGDGNKQVWEDYVTRGENVGTNIICDFENTEQYAVNIVGWVTSTGERDSALRRNGSNVDSGTVTECQNVSIENISIIANSTIALGVHCVAASFLKIDKVSILGFRNGMIVSASWPVHISESFILAYHVGLALGYDVNGGCVSNSYINKIGDMAYTVDNRIIHYSEYGEEDSLARTGIYAEYLNAVTFENVITEHWDRAYRISASQGICINAPYIEAIRDRCFSLYGTNFVINAAKVYCQNADFMRAVESCYGCINGLGSSAVYDELIESDGYCQIEFNAILTKATQKRANGIQLFRNHDFYVDSADGDDDYAGTSKSPLKTINKALSLANDGSKIYLKRGRTFTDIGQSGYIYVTKNVDIDAYGEGNNPIIQMDSPNLYLNGFTVVNSKISFNNINITVVERAYNADAKSVLHLIGLTDISFINCNIDIKSGTALIQSRVNHMAITNLYLGGTTITGNGALGANVYGGLFKIIDAKNVTTSISTDIINNGYGSNAVVISSSIV